MSMAGLLPVSHVEIAARSRLVAFPLYAHEIDAVMLLDSVMRSPDQQDEEGAERETSQRPVRPWPTKKGES